MIEIPEEVLKTLPEIVDPSKVDYIPKEFHKVNRPVCRKARPCSLCTDLIPVKTRYVNYVWRRWFTIDMFYYHGVCYRAVEIYRELSGKDMISHLEVMEWLCDLLCSKCPRKYCQGISRCKRVRNLLYYKEDDSHDWY